MADHLNPRSVIKEGEETVTMLFPNRVLLTCDRGVIDYTAGIHQVPEELSTHWYLKAHKVEKYEKSTYPILAPATTMEFTKDHIDFLQEAGMKNPTVDSVTSWFGKLSASDQAKFIGDFKEWQESRSESQKKEVSEETLRGMNKEELLQHAADHHDLDLDPGMKKDKIIAAIQEAQKG